MPFTLSSSFAGFASSACLLHGCRRPRRRDLVPPRTVTCGRKEPESGGGGPERLLMDRRDVLLGLGGLYGATSVAMPHKVIASPVMPPDLTKCQNADAPYLGNHCCPPYTGQEPVYEYEFPTTPIRVRRPAHLVKDDADYLQKYHEAVRRMKALPENDPWNYYQQALVHCQYCNNAYPQKGTDVPIQVHFSWFFLPWHRYYLHFYERILGKLIDDDTFTIPFWNWDTKEGMTFPEIFQDDSPLYDASRNQDHVKGGKILNLKYAFTETDMTDSELIQQNLCVIQKAFKYSLPLAELFMGDPVRAGQKENQEANGQLEAIHNAAHMWVGTFGDEHPYNEDMGHFSTAARDSVFYCHHSNVDRMWDIYRNFRGNSLEFDDSDWLDSTFIFYDENRKLVNVKIRDCVNSSKLRYTFEQVPLPWLGKLNCAKTTTETTDKSTTELNLTRVAEFGTKPRDLDANAPLRVLVPRPKKNRKKKDKKEKAEVLVIKDINVLVDETARFDVYVAAPYGELAGPDYGEFVGSFSRLTHKRKGDDSKPTKKAKLKLGLTSLLEDIEAEDADKLVVTLVLMTGVVSVGGVGINLLQTDTQVSL